MKKLTIVTHNSHFHTDDVFAVATLLLLLEKEYEVNVVRSRDQTVIAEADYVVDVGGVYDPDKNCFDHHQAGGAGKRENSIPYASFGLVWKKYGEQLCGSQEIANYIDQILVQPIDAIDNGVAISRKLFGDIKIYDVGDFLNAFLSTWKEEQNNVDEIFEKVLPYAKLILNREITRQRDSLEAREIIVKIYNESRDKKLIIFDEPYPALEFLSKFPEPLFFIMPRVDGTWSIRAVRDREDSFINRKDLPESWAGKSGEELEKVARVPGAIFCHSGRFLVVAKTKEAILKLAAIALRS